MKNENTHLLPPGVWPVMITPFTSDRKIDFHGLESLIEFYIASGVSGLFACCLSSEVHELTPEETIRLCSKTIEYTRQRVPVVAGIPQAGNTDQIADFAKQIIDTGARTAVITTCQIADQKESDDIWKQQMAALLDATDNISLGTYECPVPYKRVLSPELFRWITESGRINFHKDTCCDAEQIHQKLAVSTGPILRFFNAHLPTLVASLKAGGNGYSGVDTNFFPELSVWLCKNYKTAPSEQIRMVEHFLIHALEAYKYCYPRSGKRFLQMRGVSIETHCRRDVPPCTGEHEQRLADMYCGYKILIKQLMRSSPAPSPNRDKQQSCPSIPANSLE
jgi:4-hydroxy-tetrahydrodipicolinate synthase